MGFFNVDYKDVIWLVILFWFGFASTAIFAMFNPAFVLPVGIKVLIGLMFDAVYLFKEWL